MRRALLILLLTAGCAHTRCPAYHADLNERLEEVEAWKAAMQDTTLYQDDWYDRDEARDGE